MAHLLNHPLHFHEHLGPKDHGIPDAGVNCWVDLIQCIMDQPQTLSHKLLLEDQHLSSSPSPPISSSQPVPYPEGTNPRNIPDGCTCPGPKSRQHCDEDRVGKHL